MVKNISNSNALNVSKMDVSGTLTVGTLVKPEVDNVCDLGETDKRFKDLHVAGEAFIGKAGQFKICATDGTTDETFSILIGNDATGESCTADNNSIFIGPNAGKSAADSSNNIGIGKNALGGASLNTGNGKNIAIGVASGNVMTSGTNNTLLGEVSGNMITTGDNNVCLGSNSDCVATSNNQIAIGYQATCNFANQCTIGNASVNLIRPGANNVCDLGQSTNAFKNLQLGGALFVDATQVVGSQGATVADCSDAATVITQLNLLLARCRAHGLIDT